ncbi:MAG: hypothetical protein V3T54_06880 [Acidobacteriota bacterium]
MVAGMIGEHRPNPGLPAENLGPSAAGGDSAKLEGIERIIRKGVIAGVVAGLLNLGMVTLGMLTDFSEVLSDWSDPWSILDVALIFGLTYGIHRKSRAAALGLPILFLGSRLLFWAETGSVGGISVTAIFLYYFVRAAWGTFAYHRIQARSGHSPKTGKKWFFWVSVPIGLLLLVFLSVGVLVELGVIPDSAAVPGNRLSPRNFRTLLGNDLVLPGETILYFYSNGMFSILEDGNFFTEDRVVSYERWEGSLISQSASFEEISEIDADFGEGILENSTIRVATRDGGEFILLVSPEGDGDKAFFQLLRQQWRKKKGAGGEN